MDRALEISENSKTDEDLLAWLEAEIGNSVFAAESVPCAIAIFAYTKGDPWWAVRLAASIGNDSDSIATMAGAMAGVFKGHASIPFDIIDTFLTANPDFNLHDLATKITNIIE